MKSTNLLLACLFSMGTIFVCAQSQPAKKPALFSYNINLSDYTFAKNVKDSSFSNTIKQKDWLKPGNKSYGIGISYWKGLTDHIDFSGTFTTTLSSFPAGFVKNDSIGGATFSAQLDGLLHFKLLKDQALINPFLTVGVGTGFFSKKFAAYAPVGMGLQFHFAEGTYLMVQAQWRKALTNGINNDYTFYSLGFAQGKTQRQSKKKNAKKIEASKADAKKVDAKTTAIKTTSPPKEIAKVEKDIDTDGDGVLDKNDSCKNVAGLAKYNGCPIPDTDADGVNDEIDQCKTEKGTKENNGCPIKDKDGDGIADAVDKCPNVKGLAENDGCPLPPVDGATIIESTDKSITYKVEFDFDRALLLPDAYGVLKNILLQLKADNSLFVTVTGHSDSLGTATANLRISASRAKVVTDYFLSYNIKSNRVTSAYYGSQRPLDKEEQWRNRRVEITIYRK